MLLSVTECKHLSCSCAENWIFFNLLDLRKKLPIITVTFPPQCCASFQQITNKCDVLSCQYTLEDKVTWLIPQKSEKSGDHQSIFISQPGGDVEISTKCRGNPTHICRDVSLESTICQPQGGARRESEGITKVRRPRLLVTTWMTAQNARAIHPVLPLTSPSIKPCCCVRVSNEPKI